MIKRWPGFLLIAVLLILWEAASANKWIDPITFPRVTVIASSWWTTIWTKGDLLRQLMPSLGRIFTGFGFGSFSVRVFFFGHRYFLNSRRVSSQCCATSSRSASNRSVTAFKPGAWSFCPKKTCKPCL